MVVSLKTNSQLNLSANIPDRLAKGLLAISIAAISPFGFADKDERSLVLEEIVVTSAKRGAQNVQDIPFGITALDSEALSNMGVRDFEDWARSVPSLQFTDRGPGDKQLIIRGIQGAGASTVGFYWDESVITAFNQLGFGGGQSPDLKMYDIERVEVLKGPQGTLYGANSLSGAIRVITNKPNASEFSANIGGRYSVTEEGGDNYELNGTVNLPLVEDTLAARVVFWQSENSGYIDMVRPGVADDDVNEDENQGGRLSLKWDVNDALSFTVAAIYQDLEVDGVNFYDDSLSELESDDFVQQTWDEDLSLISAGFEYDAESFNLTGSISQFERDIDWIYDTTPTCHFFGIFPSCVNDTENEREVTSSEIRLSSKFDGAINFVAGVFYQSETTTNTILVNTADASGIANFLPGGHPNIFGRDVEIEIDQLSFFGEVTLTLSDQLELVAGLRNFSSDQDSLERLIQDFPPPLFGFPVQAAPIVTSDASQDESVNTYKLTLSYRPDEDKLFYVTTSTGFRPGGINSAAFAAGLGLSLPPDFEADELTNYEVGTKLTLAGGRAKLNAALFYVDWEDVPVTGNDPAGAFSFIVNAGEVSVTGAEIELNTLLTENLELNVGASYTKSQLEKDLVIPGFAVQPAFDGDDVPRVPRLQVSGSVNYRFNAFDREGLAILSGSYVDESHTAFNSDDPLYDDIGNYLLINARVGLDLSEKLKATFFVNNLGDKRAVVDRILNADENGVRTLRPRTIGLEFNYSI